MVVDEIKFVFVLTSPCNCSMTLSVDRECRESIERKKRVYIPQLLSHLFNFSDDLQRVGDTMREHVTHNTDLDGRVVNTSRYDHKHFNKIVRSNPSM